MVLLGMASAPGHWGRLAFNDFASTTVTIIGSIIQVIAFLLLGPAPFIPVEKSLGLCIFALVLRGIGNAVVLVSTYGATMRTALSHNYPDDLHTAGIVSGYGRPPMP